MKPFLTILLLLAGLNLFGQTSNERIILGEQNARKAVKQALNDKNYKPFYDTLIKDKKVAISVAEAILFNIYGRKNITRQKPYECYLIDGCWYINGTLRKDWLGGVFEIIISAEDGKVIKLVHGK